jgi:alpha-amylase
VELVAETRHHSLAGLADARELEAQVALHAAELEATFGRRPTVFRDTELIWHDGLAETVARMGFRAVLVEGAPAALAFRSPDRVYESAPVPGLRMLPRNFRLSDDLGFRFTDRSWEGWPLDARTWAGWVAGSPGESVHVFLDYETFGEHHGPESGILGFLEALPDACRERGVGCILPSELAARAPAGALSFPAPVSWADEDRGVTAWLGNRIQRAAHARLWRLRQPVLSSADPDRIERWRRLTTSDHLYYMSTKGDADGRVHGRFRPFETPYDAFIAFMNVLQDLERELETSTGEPALAAAHSLLPTGGRIPSARSNPRPAALRWPAFG